MHEFSLMTGIMRRIQEIAAEHQAQRVTGVRVRVGALSHLSTAHFREHFEELAKGSLAEHARLFVEIDKDAGSPEAQNIVLESVDLE